MAESAAPPPAARIALFIDSENLIGGASSMGVPIDVEPIVQSLKEHGRVLVRRCFGDIKKCLVENGRASIEDNIRRMFHRNLVQIEDIPFLTAKKNTCDVRLVVEALTIAFTDPSISHFAVVSSDRDYVPLYNKLHELGRSVITVAIDRENTNAIIVEASDLVIYYENLFKLPEVVAGPGHEPPPSDEAVLEKTRHEYFKLLQQAVRVAMKEGRTANGAWLAQMMRQLRSDFDPSVIGLASFKDFVKLAEERRHVVVNWRKGVGDFNVEPGEDEPIQPASTSPASSRPGAPADRGRTVRLARKFVEEKLRVPLPGLSDRARIISTAAGVYEEIIRGGPFSLEEWKDAIMQRVQSNGERHVDQRAVYKILLSLHYARAFACEVSHDRHNPTIVGCRAQPDRWERMLVLNLVRQMDLEQQFRPLDPEVLVEVFYAENRESGQAWVEELLEELKS